ncbi:MAG TPA: apolipoprotein N-acyltransferase [Pyrinomonadaceae bacterium]|nr:apolipoprotein N-acyltransferase [Pyrinomonadaceae bacterium]
MNRLTARARSESPTLAEAGLATLTALLLTLSFPDFDLWPLAWVALVPLVVAVARRPRAVPSLLSGWLAGTLFFYASCYWLTVPMTRYAGFPAWLAYPLLLPVTVAAGFFPALFALGLSRLCARWGAAAVWAAPALWAAAEWARLGAIGQLWNALGYSQAFVSRLVQPARFGGVYAVGFLVVAVNVTLAYALLRRGARSLAVSLAAVALVAAAFVSANVSAPRGEAEEPSVVVVAVQPNVLPDFDRPVSEYRALSERHFEMSRAAVLSLDAGRGPLSALPRVVVWPESPMNFRYARDSAFRERVAAFAREHRAALLFNSLEPAPDEGGFNAAVLVNEEGRLAFQYDKIRLMPFGEYVPLPRWLPFAEGVRGVVGEFTPGASYTVMSLGGGEGGVKAGVFICLESAYPHITRRFVEGGADVLIEITNDAYQGDTAVLRQHMANAVFRAAETARPVLRVTNTGITARISPRGEVLEEVEKNRQAVQAWPVARSDGSRTFYVRHGDLFAVACASLSLLTLAATFAGRGRLREPFARGS